MLDGPLMLRVNLPDGDMIYPESNTIVSYGYKHQGNKCDSNVHNNLESMYFS